MTSVAGCENAEWGQVTRPLSCLVLVLALCSAAAAQSASVSPTSLNFLTQVLNTTSAAKVVTLTNTGTISLSITSITTSGDFAQTNTCGSSLAGGAKCTINVTFTPTAIGNRTGTLSVNDNAGTSPQTVALSGSGTMVSVSPGSLAFATTPVGVSSPPQTVTLVNVSSTATLKITAVSITGTNASDFSQSNTCGSSVAPGVSCVVSVTFKPTASGSRKATLGINDNGGASPQTVALTGTGSSATLTSIAVTPANPTVAAGTTQQFTATGTYSDGSTQNLTATATWSSSNTAVATVSNASGTQGLASGLTQGSATITATSGSVSGSTTLTVGPPVLVSMAITPANPSIALGTTQQFTATGTYSDGSTQNLTTTATWSSSNTGVATVSNNAGSQGLASSVAQGTTTITALSGSISATTVLTVTPAVLMSIAVTPAIPSLPQGTTQQFTATGTYSDGSTQDITSTAQWTSSNTGTATINSSGLATAVAQGSTTITAASNSVSGSTTLTVTAAALVSIAVTPANLTLGSGVTQQFTATGTYTDGSTQNLTSSATWVSSDTTIATLSSSGLATTVSAGSTTISATSGAIIGSTTLNVTSVTLVSITVAPADPAIALGTTQQFTATGTYSDGSTQDLTTAAYWTSSAMNVATISDSSPTIGLATSTGVGTTTITATSGNISATATLTITPAVLELITLTPANPAIPLGTTQQFTATGTYSDGSTQDLTTTATWSSSANTVAVISNDPGSQGLATSASAGTATMTATVTTTSGPVAGSTLLTVNPPALVALAVTPVNPTIAQGGTQQFTATGTYSDGSTQDLTTAVTWSSSTPAVASITSTGLATGLAGGSSTISATSGSITNSTLLTVTTSSPTLTSITVTPVNPTLQVGFTLQFAATGNYSDGSTQNLTSSATWGSANTNVATVQSTGKPDPGLATGINSGTTNIQATYGGISGTTQIIVGQVFVATPLEDLGTGTYLSFQGGLYEDGTNTLPSDHLADGLNFANEIQPRDTSGNPSATGKFVFLSIGMSNATDEFNAFELQAKKNPSVNTTTQVIANGAAGSMQACAWVQPFGPPPCASVSLPNQYDRIRDNVLAAVGLTEAQVEVLWLDDCNRNPGPNNYPPLCDPTMGGCTNTTQTEAIHYEQQLGQILRAAKTRYPNLILAFISSRYFGGYSVNQVSPEPYAYEYGFSTKWAIQAQVNQIRTGAVDPIAGDLSYGLAPWAGWAAYTWADGPNPRSDGLVWCDGQTGSPCNSEIDFQTDGMHANQTGMTKAGGLLLNFFLTSPVTTPWFSVH